MKLNIYMIRPHKIAPDMIAAHEIVPARAGQGQKTCVMDKPGQGGVHPDTPTHSRALYTTSYISLPFGLRLVTSRKLVGDIVL